MVQKRVALVTGGAVRIGAAIVEALAADGYAVVIHCLDSQNEALVLADKLKKKGSRAATIVADLVDPEAVSNLIPEAIKLFGPITLLVNNASLFHSDTLHSIEVAAWNKQFSVNIRAPSVLAKDMASHLPENQSGAIVNIVDQRVWKLTPQHYSYTLSKAALWAATQTMAQTLAPRIRVNAVGPGPTVGNIHEGDAGVSIEAAGTLLRHRVDPAEIAKAVVYLASARHVTGQMIAVDSGQHLGWRTPDIVD